MRRQVKPFVTEYRASSRRKDASSPSGRVDRDAPREGEANRELFAAPFNSATANTNSDDSYEAALKAADALFSSPQPSSEQARSERSLSRRSSGDPDMVKPSRKAFAEPSRPHAAAEAVFAPVAPVPHGTSESAEPIGRILRAIEAPEVDPFAALEAERAPKRRGRKPGSKNKPKVVPALLAATAPAALARPAAHPPRALQAPVETSATMYTALPSDGGTSSRPGSFAVGQPAAAQLDSKALDSKAKERFAWVRTKLRPGEKWKRRLPKVAW